MDAKRWLSEVARRNITDTDIANILDVTRKTANKRVNEGLSADDIITITRALGISPTMALVELGKLTHSEVMDFMDSDGTLLANASTEQLIYQLAEESLPASERIALGAAAKALIDRRDELASRRPPQPPADDEIAAALEEANQFKGAAHPRTPRLDEPEAP